MDQKLQILLEKLQLEEEYYPLFETAKLKKIVVSRNQNSWVIFLDLEKFLPVFLYEKMDALKKNLTEKDVTFYYEVKKGNVKPLLEGFPEVLDKIEKLPYKERYLSSLQEEDGELVLVASNKVEALRLEEVQKEIEKEYAKFGYRKEIPIVISHSDENISSLIQKDLEVDLEMFQKKAASKEDATIKQAPSSTNSYPRKARAKQSVEEGCILGRKFDGNALSISAIQGEDDNIIVEAFAFGVDYFESSRSDFKIITLKLTDYTDSIYCKVFVRDTDEYQRLCKVLKQGNWFRIRGYTKNDSFSKELVLNARDILPFEKKEEKVVDTAEEKRVELHAHTMMSQMDGVCDEVKLVKQAIAFGHRGIAITDHNGAQAFPHVYNYVKGYNKKLEEGKEPFKVLYGTELLMIDDSVDIVVRPNDGIMLEQEYVVFDFETTGFNAGGADSIIEIGAVKIKDGAIIERYDELINPGRKLPQKIIDVTNITDEMLQDKDNEENAVKRFIAWFGDLPMVAHNAKFDVSFLEMAYQKYNLGTFQNPVLDTLEISRTLDSGYARHSLSALVKRYEIPWDESAHHRGDYDAEGTALVFWKMLKKLDNRNISRMNELDQLVDTKEIYKFGRGHHINLLALNKKGLKNLFKIISYANTEYLYKTPRITRSKIEQLREGLLVGSGCYESEVFKEAKSKSEEELTNIIRFYDYVEVQPMECYQHLIETGDFGNQVELQAHLEKIIRTTREAGKKIVATGDVHHILREDKIYREIIVNQKVPGGGRHPLARGGITEIPSNHFRTTDEMLSDFSFLDEKLRREIVITNPNEILDMAEDIEVIIDTGGIPFSPKIENSEETVKELVYGKAHAMYGEVLPKIIEERIDQELTGIIKGGFDVIYLIAQKLVKHSNDDGYIVGSRGSVGSSFVATMMGITEVNPLPAHYLCYHCKYSEFENEKGEAYGKEYSSGYDLPDKICPKCGKKLGKEGQDMPFATFLGFNADKVPDIDLNFSGEYQWKAHEYTKELFGVDNVYRAGTIGTVADKTAFGYVKGYLEEHNIPNMRTAEIERLALGCTGVKRTTGQHPGGIVVIPGYMDVFDFTPFQYPADDNTSRWRTTHFDYHAIDQDVLKLDILGHDDPTVLRMLQDLSGIDVTKLPMDDEKVFSLLRTPDALGVSEKDILCPTGTLGLPELGTKFVIQMLVETKPKTFSELVKISGLSHGTDVWTGNASELIKNNVVPFKEVIGCRDDIMVTLMNEGMEPKDAFKIMEFVRKGKASKEPENWLSWKEKMEKANIPSWYIESCHKIKYMFPKAHACAYVMSALRIAWFKVYKPLYYYATYFSVRVSDFAIDTMIKGEQEIRKVLEDLIAKGFEATNKETNIIETLRIALEATARGIHFGPIDLEKSDATKFLIDENHENTLIPPFSTIDGLGGAVAQAIVEERAKRPFLSKEDLQTRGKVSKTLTDRMTAMGIIKDLPESNQLSLF